MAVVGMSRRYLCLVFNKVRNLITNHINQKGLKIDICIIMPTNSKEYMRKYYQDHKDKFLKHALSKVICQTCGSKLLKSNLSRHQKTVKCKNESNLKV